MHHVVFLVKRRPDMTQDEFARYWIGDHTPLTARVEGLRAYRCYPAAGHDHGAPFDGVAILSFDDQTAAERAFASEAFAAALADAPHFQNTELTTSFVADEHHVV